jgi:putative Mg2+ transporter-C (MgtC) family protein
MFPEIVIQLSLSVLFGAIIGFEREYRSKAAGFRTITMITLGSTLFTVLSYKLGSDGSHDRIAANIITGIGFIGAGVIFKDGFSVSGLTTASTIWVSAAIGMAIGVSEYVIAVSTLVFAIVVLAFFEKVQDLIESFHQVRTYRINFENEYKTAKQNVEEKLFQLRIDFKIKKTLQTTEGVSFFYNLSGNQKQLDDFSEFLINLPSVTSFDE